MTEYEKAIEEISRDCFIPVGYARRVLDAGYRRVEKGDIIVHKDSNKRTVEELAFFIKHNDEVRKERSKEILKRLVGYEFDDDGWSWVVSKEDIAPLAKEYGVEVEE